MLVEIKDVEDPRAFKPYQIIIEVQSFQEERVLAELYNHSSSIGSMLKDYRSVAISSHNSATVSEAQVMHALKSMFRTCFEKVYT